jgi:hypothetical protein
LTRGAGHAWEAINHQLTETQGALFWIGGSIGAGKTHFLNYVLALSARAGVLGNETGRHIALPIEIAGRVNAAGIDRRIIEALGAALTGGNRSPALLSEMRGPEALTIEFDRARRQGVQAVTIVIDFGLDETNTPQEVLASLAEVGRSLKKLRLIVVAAGRGKAPDLTQAFDVTPRADEEIAVAVGRARRFDDSALRMVDALYGHLEGSWEGRAIYPLHPAAANALRSLYSDVTVGTLANAVREVIEPWFADGDFQLLVMPGDLMRSAAVRRALDTHLSIAGRTALKIAKAAAAANDNSAGAIQQELVNTLVMLHVGGAPSMISLNELRELMALAGRAEAVATVRALTALANRAQGGDRL